VWRRRGSLLHDRETFAKMKWRFVVGGKLAKKGHSRRDGENMIQFEKELKGLGDKRSKVVVDSAEQNHKGLHIPEVGEKGKGRGTRR
jgi:hypothetical protein